MALKSRVISGRAKRLIPLAAALLGRSQNWLAGKAGISPGYLSMLVNEGRAPSGRIRRRIQEALGIEDFHQLFRLEDRDENP